MSAGNDQDAQIAANMQRLEDGRWVPAVPLLRKATWLEVALDRWIGPRHGAHPWLCVAKGLMRRA